MTAPERRPTGRQSHEQAQNAPAPLPDAPKPVDGLNRDWPGRAEVLRSFGGDLDLDVVDQIDAAHTTTDRTDS